MPADKTMGDEEKTGRRRRTLTRTRPAVQAAEVEDRTLSTGKGRATPSRRHQDEEEEGGNVATRGFGSLREYFEGVRSEIQKVVWPTREEITRLTIIVSAALIVCAIVLGAISLLFTELFRIGLGSPAILLGTMVIAVGGGLIYTRLSSRRSTY